MKLPFSFQFNKKELPNYFLALLLRDRKTTAVVFAEEQGKVHVVGEHEIQFHDSIEVLQPEQLLQALDKAISTAENDLPDNVETKKTILGVQESWTEETKIKKEYLSKLKKVCESLGLEPIGFLVITEALVHLLEKEEGAPVSALLVEVAKQSVTITIVRAGRIIETKKAEIQGSAVATTDSLLKHFSTASVLPARVILLDGGIPSGKEAHESLIQAFLGHTWSKSLPFLHVPQIQFLPHGIDARAILFGAATQMGFEVSKHERKLSHVPHTPVASMMSLTEEAEQEMNEEQTVTDNEAPETFLDKNADNFGFVMEKDISNLTEETPDIPIEKNDETAPEETKDTPRLHETESNMHATTHHDNPHANLVEPDLKINDRSREDGPTYAVPVDEAHTRHAAPHTGGKVSIGELLKGMFAGIGFIKNIPFPSLRGGNKLIFIPPVVIALALMLVAGYIFLLKATVTLNIEPRVVEQAQDVTFAIDSPSDFDKNAISVQTYDVTQEGSVSTAATGTKEVGEKAKGSVTLYSRFTEPRTFAAGTTLTSTNGIQFTLDSAVSVGSASGDASAGSVTVKANVTAKNIGKEANLPSNTSFTVASFDKTNIVAKNDSAFSGGSKKEVTVVSRADVNKLLKQLPEDLEEEAKDAAEKEAPDGSTRLPTFVAMSVEKEDFDKKVGDEANSVTLKGTVAYKSIAYKKDELAAFAQALLEKDQKDLSLSKDSVEIDISEITDQSDESVTAKATLKATFVPTIDTDSVAKNIAGKSFDSAHEIVSKIPQVKSADLTLSPNIPFLPQILPRMAKNITVVTHNE